MTANGKLIAILATDGFEQSELMKPQQLLKDAGFVVHVIALKSGEIRGWDKNDWGQSVAVDRILGDASADDYDALVLPGGVMNPDKLRTERAAVDFVKAFDADGKPIAAICHGPWLLVESGVAKGRQVTSWPSLQTDLKTLASGLTSLSSSIINSLATNAFAARAATISSTGDVSASAALSMTVAAGAATGDHTLQIGRLATAEKVIGAAQSSQTAALGYSGTFSIGLSGGSTSDVTITSGMSLQDVADAINAQSTKTNVGASIVQVSSGSYQLVLTGAKDGADISYTSTSGDDIRNKLAEIAREIFDDDTLAVTDALAPEDVKAWDSLGHIRLIAATEEAFGVAFTIDEIEGMKSIGQIAALVEQKA